ncbi:hypothetical protein [Ensifer canadensis]|uniref:hypothetical protein n=1 Tax=Ensifer canadensis TaxID=555315 RepID=UPI0035E3C997
MHNQEIQKLKAALSAHQEVLCSIFSEYRMSYAPSDIARADAELLRIGTKFNAPDDCFDAVRKALQAVGH